MRVIALLFALVLYVPAALAQDGMTPAKQLLFQLVNQHRAENGLPPLTWDPALARAAQAHAERMSQEPGNTQHQYAGEPDLIARAAQAGAHFSKISENIGAATTNLSDIDSAWMQSPQHRANILNPQLNTVGIGVVHMQGTLYAVQDFAHADPALSPDEIEARAQQALSARGLKVETSEPARQAARATCNSSSATAPAGTMAAMQFDCTDLNQLPDIVLKAMPQAKEHVMAVGACGNGHAQGNFTTYQVAVLVYSGEH